MSDGSIAVTGATGEVGGRVTRGLTERGLPQRLIVRDPSRAPKLDGAEVAQASNYEARDEMEAALEGASPFFADADGVIRGPGGDGRFAPVARDDVADVVVELVTDPVRDGQAYEVAGDEAYAIAQAAERLGKAIGQEITWTSQGTIRSRSRSSSSGTPSHTSTSCEGPPRRSRGETVLFRRIAPHTSPAASPPPLRGPWEPRW